MELPVGERRARFTVSGIWRDYARQHGAIVIERSEYLKLTGDRTGLHRRIAETGIVVLGQCRHVFEGHVACSRRQRR